MGRAPCCDEKLALKRGPWTPDEDQKLVAYIREHGHGSWRALPEKAGLARCGKSCRLRWTNYLRPDIKRGRFSHEEDQMIIQLHAILGNRWSAIASHLPRRTDNEIKNYWNTHLKKRLSQMGIDSITHQTSSAGLALSPAWTPLVSTQLTHTTQWDCALAEAEARLSKTPLTALTELQGALAPHPSAFFMRSWKTKVEDTLRPTFGAVKLEPRIRVDYSTPVPAPVGRPQKFVQDWSTALGIHRDISSSPFLQKYSAMAMKNEFPFSTSRVDAQSGGSVLQAKPDLLVDMFSGAEAFGEVSASGRSENLFIFSASEGVGLENHFSPMSILQGPDSDSSSPCGSASGDSDCFQFLGSYHNFPHISGESEHAESATMSVDIPESFWQGQPASMQPESLLAEMNASEAGLELIIPLDFNNADEFDPQFESLCQGAQLIKHIVGSEY